MGEIATKESAAAEAGAEGAKADEQAMKNLEAEIGAAVDAVSKADDEVGEGEGAAAEKPSEGEKEAEPEVAPDGEGEGSAEADDDEGPGEGEGAEEGGQKSLSDAAIERAVKCGFSLSEIKQYPDDALLTAACGRIEGAAADSGSQGGAGDHDGEGEPAGVEEMLAAIPDLDAEDYDEKIVAGFKSMKEIVRKLAADNAELRGGQRNDWFSSKLEGVKDLTKGDSAKAGSVREKFDVLMAGYKAAGKDVSNDAVFDEAARLALGADMAAAELEKKGQAAKRRSKQRLNRPTNRNVAATPPDVYEATAAEIDSKFSS